MTGDQRIVAAHAAAGVAAMIASVWLLSRLLPPPTPMSVGDGIAFALQWNALAAVPLLLMIVVVGNGRFLSGAIDPTLGQERPSMLVDRRVIDNTVQQSMLFLVGSLALAADLSPDELPIVGAAAITFTAMRLAFWIGYRIRPVYRAFGFAGTASLNFGLLAAALWRSVS